MKFEKFNINTGKNEKLKKVIKIVENDTELNSLWKCSNITAIDRMGYSDHGPTHIKIVARNSLKLFKLIRDSGVISSVEKNYSMTRDDAEVVIFLAAVMHDIGMSVHRTNHQEYSVALAIPIATRILKDIYKGEKLYYVRSEILHAIMTHHYKYQPLTIEAGCVRVADALDMEKGRARIPFNLGKIDIHSVSALSIEKVEIRKGNKIPVEIRILMRNSSGIFQIDKLLREKLKNSGIEKYIKVVAETTKEEKRIVKHVEL